MHILLVHNRYRQPGGEETHLQTLFRGLGNEGLDTELFEVDSGSLNTSVRKATALAGLAYRPGSGGLAKRLRRRVPDIVHFHNTWPLLTPASFRAAKRAGCGVVWTLHNYRFACPSGTLLRNAAVHEDCVEGSSFVCGIKGARENRIESVAYGGALSIQRKLGMLTRWVDLYIAPSAFLRRIAVRSGLPPERIVHIPYGVPVGPDTGPSPRGYALFVGRLSEEKGIRTLLRAAEQVPEIPFRIAGAGPLAHLADGAPENVVFMGRVTGAQLAALVEGAAFTVAPSEWHDNLPFAALESLAAARAVIGTRMGGIPEIASHGRTGFLVPPRDPERLGNAIRCLWEDKNLNDSLNEAARRRALESYEAASQTAAIVEAYRRLLAG